MSPEPTTREAEVTESSTSQLTSFCQLNVLLLLSCRNDKDFEFLLLTFSKLSPFISSVVSCSNLDTEKLSGWWDPLYFLHSVLISDCLLKGSIFSNGLEGKKPTESISSALLRRLLHIYNGETRIASFFSSVWEKQGNGLHIVIGLNSLLTPF